MQGRRRTDYITGPLRGQQARCTVGVSFCGGPFRLTAAPSVRATVRAYPYSSYFPTTWKAMETSPGLCHACQVVLAPWKFRQLQTAARGRGLGPGENATFIGIDFATPRGALLGLEGYVSVTSRPAACEALAPKEFWQGSAARTIPSLSVLVRDLVRAVISLVCVSADCRYGSRR